MTCDVCGFGLPLAYTFSQPGFRIQVRAKEENVGSAAPELPEERRRRVPEGSGGTPDDHTYRYRTHGFCSASGAAAGAESALDRRPANHQG